MEQNRRTGRKPDRRITEPELDELEDSINAHLVQEFGDPDMLDSRAITKNYRDTIDQGDIRKLANAKIERRPNAVQFQIYQFRVVHGWTYQEIAIEFGCTINDVNKSIKLVDDYYSTHLISERIRRYNNQTSRVDFLMGSLMRMYSAGPNELKLRMAPILVRVMEYESELHDFASVIKDEKTDLESFEDGVTGIKRREALRRLSQAYDDMDASVGVYAPGYEDPQHTLNADHVTTVPTNSIPVKGTVTNGPNSPDIT